MIEDSETRVPFTSNVNCVNEDKWGGDIYLPKHENNVYDETAETPSMAYLVGYSHNIHFPLCLDTGAGRSLMNFETWKKINAYDKLELKPQHRGFEAVNGSRIHCKGSVVLRVMLMGITKNYEAYFKFFVVEGLSVDALLGLDEIYRHGIKINTNEGFAWHESVGALKSNLIFKGPYDIGAVLLDEGVSLDPGEAKVCSIKRTIPLNEEIAIMEPTETKSCIKIPRALINGQTEVTMITNIGEHKQTIEQGTPIAKLYTGRANTVGVLQGQKEKEDALEMGISIEPDDQIDTCDFGLHSSDLTDDDIARAKSLILEYKDLFQWGEGPLSCAHKYEHEIRLIPGAKPVKHKTRRFSEEQEKIISQEVEKLLKQGVIEKSNSPWSSRIVLAWNHYKGKYRVCLDLRDLNARSLADSYPLPNLQDLLQKLAGSKYFTTLDLYQGFHQYNLKKECREYTAFQTPRHGLVHYVRVPFGAKTAPNGFERLMEEVLGDLHMAIALVFIDDLCVFSATVEEGLKRLRAVFEKLREANMKLRPSKCKLLQVQVEYLGSIVSKDGITVANRIIEAVVDFKTPTNPKGVMRFAGLANFYREHIKNFAEIMYPLTKLTKKSVKWEWTNECEMAFQQMKTCLTSAPVRHFIDFTLPIVLACDASTVGLGCVLSNLDEGGRLRLVAFGSKTLKGPELNWSTTEKELYAIFIFVRKFKHFLSGRKFIVQSDHHSLKFISGAKDSTGKITRMLNFLQGFNFEIHHIPGTQMEQIGPDILSRSMLPLSEQPQDVLARRLERPVLKLNHNFSPFLMSWFSIENPEPAWFDQANNLIINKQTIGYELSGEDNGKSADRREDKVYINLRKILKQDEHKEEDQPQKV